MAIEMKWLSTCNKTDVNSRVGQIIHEKKSIIIFLTPNSTCKHYFPFQIVCGHSIFIASRKKTTAKKLIP